MSEIQPTNHVVFLVGNSKNRTFKASLVDHHAWLVGHLVGYSIRVCRWIAHLAKSAQGK